MINDKYTVTGTGKIIEIKIENAGATATHQLINSEKPLNESCVKVVTRL